MTNNNDLYRTLQEIEVLQERTEIEVQKRIQQATADQTEVNNRLGGQLEEARARIRVLEVVIEKAPHGDLWKPFFSLQHDNPVLFKDEYYDSNGLNIYYLKGCKDPSFKNEFVNFKGFSGVSDFIYPERITWRELRHEELIKYKHEHKWELIRVYGVRDGMRRYCEIYDT